MINAYTANAKIFLTLLKSTKGKPSVGWHCIKLALLNLIGGLYEEGTDKDIILHSSSVYIKVLRRIQNASMVWWVIFKFFQDFMNNLM